MDFITTGDLLPFTSEAEPKLLALISDFTATAISIAPCLGSATAEADLTENQKKLVKAVLRSAILRWLESGGGNLQQQVAGPFAVSIDSRQQRRGMFLTAEVNSLQGVCSDPIASGAFSIDTLSDYTAHYPWCSLMFGAEYCSCGVDIAGVPIFEGG